MVDASTKWLLLAGLTVLQLAFMRYAVHFTITLVQWAHRPLQLKALLNGQWRTVLLRSFCLVSATVVNFIGLGHLPLAVTSSIMFFAPVLVCLLSRVILGEALTQRRIVSVIFGFLGVLIVVNPFGSEINWIALIMLYSAFALALYVVLTRLLADRVSGNALQISTGALGTIVLMPLALTSWESIPSTGAWVFLLCIGAFAWAGHEVLTKAHQYGEAGFLAPYGYSFVLYLSLIGWLVFGEVPSQTTTIGAVIIVLAGLVALGSGPKQS